MDGCKGVPIRAVGKIVLKGKTQALQVYTPLATLDPMACAPVAEYNAALALMTPGGPESDVPAAASALVLFEALAKRYPQDPLVALHYRRLLDGATDDVIVMAEK
ncbi:MAG: hypothetical protein CFE44_05270 [Burkholderiales bacterium PBB4]|nr:MAG: hypothetical protein CFE44_05270 [Burkholderiales bacterium PBB4]